MSARPLHTLSLVALLSLLVRVTSAAEEPGTGPTPPSSKRAAEHRNEAKAKYQQGALAYAAGRYKDAVDLFLDADRLAPSAPLSFNVALAYENLGDGSGALRWYRDYLRRDPRAQNAEVVRATIAALAAALAQKGVQQLTVMSTPVGATVAIDGQPLGVAPWTGELSPGRHRLLLTLRGYADAERDIELPAGEPIDISVPLALPAPAPVGGERPPPHGPRFGPLSWIALGVGAAALGGAVTFEVLRRSAENAARHDPTQLGYQSHLDTEQSRQTAARVLLGVGGAFVVAGGVMLVLDPPHASGAQAARADFICLPQLCAATARGSF
jgi:tetratricopeptide (TPR) repeat protein